MKKLFSLLALIVTLTTFAQAPQGFNYQATVRNSSGALITNQNVYFKFNVMLNSQTSVPVFTETHYVPTDDVGQVNLIIGQGTATTGVFSSINWGTGNYYLGIELNTGAGYVAMGTTQLLSVPYALYANSSGNSNSNFNFPNGTNVGDILNWVWNGSSWVPTSTSSQVPAISTTPEVTSITANTAVCGGTIISGSGISSCGIVWGISDPSLNSYDGIITENVTTGSFTSYLTDLTPGTQYYVRAYATNSAGTSYGDEVSFVTQQVIAGEITGDFTNNTQFAIGTYSLNGIVKIQSGVTITFEAGSIITADATNGVDALVVLNGGKLIMNGTAAEPIVMTELSSTPGSWGGIIMYGDAPIVGAGGVSSATSEDGLALPYGGTNSVHNGGSLKYVRVEYAGKKITDGTSEMSGFSFYSVGSGTILENLVSYKGADDGFEFYGGTVSLKNAISYGNFDDSFDWQDGWRGQENSNWYAYQTGTGNFGMEIESKSINNAFFPKVTNITLKRADGTATENASIEYDAIQFKKEGNGDFSNILIDGYSATRAVAVRIQDAVTNTNQVNGGKIKLTNIKINGTTTASGSGASSFSVAFPADTFTMSTTATGASLTPGAWSTVNAVNLLQ